MTTLKNVWNSVKSFGRKVVAWFKEDFAFIMAMF